MYYIVSLKILTGKNLFLFVNTIYLKYNNLKKNFRLQDTDFT